MRLDPSPPWFSTFRQGQLEAIARIYAAFQRSSVVILDAPTGAGKSLVAEATRQILRARKTTYLCSTKTLQHQIAHDFPYAKVIKGRDNYPTLDFPERFPRLTADACTKAKGDACARCPIAPGPEDLHCLYCHPWYRCPYEVAKGDALNAPLSVANIAYFLTEANGPGRFSDRPFVVLDECDLAESELMRFVEVGISEFRMKKYKLTSPRFKTKPESWTDWAYSYAIPQLQSIRARVDGDDDRARKEKRWLNNTIDNLMAADFSEGWVYSDRSGVFFRPVMVKDFAPKLLFSHADRWLLMSATVISAEQLAQDLGIPHYEYVEVASTFPKERRPIVMRPAASMAYKKTQETNRGNWHAVGNEIARILTTHPGERVLIHAVSYQFGKYLVEHLQSPRVLSYYSSSERDQAISEFRRQEGAVLVAPSLDRGVDLPQDLCRVVIVAKVPNPDLGDKVVSTRLYGTHNGPQWYAVQTVRTLIQQFGRGMRSEKDWFVGYLVDGQGVDLLQRHRELFPQWFLEAVDWSGGMHLDLEQFRRDMNEGDVA